MADPRVQGMRNLMPRFVAAGVDFNDARRVLDRLEQWDDWAREWSAVGAEHEALATEAAAQEQWVTAGEAWLRAAVLYHFAKYLYYDHPADYRAAHDALQRAYRAAMPHLAWPVERIEVPYAGTVLPCTLRRPHGADRPPLVLLSHGLDATKEEYHVFGEAFLRRGMATLGFDGPGQGEARLPPEDRAGLREGGRCDPRPPGQPPRPGPDPRRHRRGQPRRLLRAAGGGLRAAYWRHRHGGRAVRLRRLLGSSAAAVAPGPAITTPAPPTPTPPAPSPTSSRSPASRRACSARRLLVHGERDTLVPPSEVARLARELGGPVDMVLYPEGDHVCHNITYKYRPRVADWMAGQLKSEG